MGEKPKKKKRGYEFEFCAVCKLNHDQGRGHKYLPSHTKSLTTFLSRFLQKLSDVRFFLKSPTLLRPEHASRNLLWCVFCDSDVQELDSLFACGNAIRHLASSEHLKNLKDFLWKHGGGMHRVDAFRVSESDFTNWEKRCVSLKDTPAATSIGRSYGPSMGPLKDIHTDVSSDYRDSFEQSSSQCFISNVSNGFLPLQDFTRERIQVSQSSVHDSASCSRVQEEATGLPVGMVGSGNFMNGLKANGDDQCLMDLGRNSSLSRTTCSEMVHQFGRNVTGNSSDQVLQSLTHISLPVGESSGNVHSGAPPPWLGGYGDNQLNLASISGFLSKNSRKTSKLNPKRVGAAWAEKRKIELEMERRGELSPNNLNADWLPNFGRVWQFGSRKESRKEFEMEKTKSVTVDNISETPIKLQPYVSKRMRRNADGRVGDAHSEDAS
ncbi:hypothetical protein Sjap_016509 [Stephania japonica]|uniref:TITAN-like protein n=1 Tax=Stephania japonica TaxID=461633 RepID=A0AAP0NRX3_9MAGN